jgi:hypothetical protein
MLKQRQESEARMQKLLTTAGVAFIALVVVAAASPLGALVAGITALPAH